MSQHTVTFDHTNQNWTPNTDHNLVFLRCQERYLNDLLQARGFVFLNELNEILGFKWTPEGQVEGWVAEHYIDLQFSVTDAVVEVTVMTSGSILHKINQDLTGDESGFHDVIMVAFDISGPDAETAHEWLHSAMPEADYKSDTGVYLDSWWVANDERFDGSDCDSAVFVSQGSQENARRVLRSHGYAN